MPIVYGPNASVPPGHVTAWGFAEYSAGQKNVVEPHFHDCDEYYMLIEGRMRVRSEGVEYTMGPADILLTRMGDEHEIIEILEDVRFVWMETELKGRRRMGHLHRGIDD
jgi:mannose-6-phosphate isomerase-like protein (cupin superfamily)